MKLLYLVKTSLQKLTQPHSKNDKTLVIQLHI